MVKVTISNNVKRIGPMIKNPDVTTIRSLLVEAGMDDSGATKWAINGISLSADEFDCTLSSFGATATASLTAIQKAVNA